MMNASATPSLQMPWIPVINPEIPSVNDTAFFRDGSTFSTIREVILPKVIARNAAERRLRIWSAGCSTGQEPYSLAMLLCEHFSKLATWDVQILATDISPAALHYAAQGHYKRPEVNRGLPARFLLKYFDRHAEEWRLHSRVRQMCRFERLDLCAVPSSLPRFDFVLLRNVLFYLPRTVRPRVFDAVHAHLSPQGFLVLGAAEQAEDSTHLFQPDFSPRFCFYRPLPHSLFIT